MDTNWGSVIQERDSHKQRERGKDWRPIVKVSFEIEREQRLQWMQTEASVISERNSHKQREKVKDCRPIVKV